jgi:phosphoribosylformylglycinamidine cyclo-ligase
LRPSVIYTPAVLDLLGSGVDVHAIAHITGGGLPGNLPRVLARDVDAVLDPRRWEIPRVFHEIQSAGRIADEEMFRVFNMGLGMVVAVDETSVEGALDRLEATGHQATVVGDLRPGGRIVRFL